jgi:hypothetical protein
MTSNTKRLGSVGPMWPPEFDERNHRVKGFCSEVINRWSEYTSKLEELHRLANEKCVSRITARFILSNGTNIDGRIEARIPLDGRWKGHELIYYGQNKEDRADNLRILEEEKRRIDYIMDTSNVLPVPKKLAFARVKRHGSTLSFLEQSISEGDLENLVDLYKSSYDEYTIPLTSESIRTLIGDPGNLVAVARENDTGKIISIAIAETHSREVQTNKGPRTFSFSELSDAATYPDRRGEGIYTAIGISLMSKLTERNVDLVYGEARACNFGVNVACRKMGRAFYGTLQKHCVMQGLREVEEQGIYENLHVWAITHDELHNLFKE